MEQRKSDKEEQGVRPRLVIIGGGFGGLALAKKLKEAPLDVLLVDKHNYHTFQPLLYQVATGAIASDDIAFPIRRIFTRYDHFNFMLAEVSAIHPETNSLSTSAGTIDYDYLVIATGATTNYFGNAGISRYVMPMKDLPEALNLRITILQNIERAAITTDMEEKAALMTFVVVGGGPTGVELAGALAEMRNLVLMKDYHGLSASKMKIYLVEGKSRLLAAMSERASETAERFLRDAGVTVLTDFQVRSYDGMDLVISEASRVDRAMSNEAGAHYENDVCNEKRICARTVIWAAGITAVVPDGFAPSAMVKGNRLQTDEFSRVKGYDNIFAIGDVAAQLSADYPNGYPGVAPVAIQQAEQLADNLVRLVKKEATRPFRYTDKGSMATIGRNQAVADMGRLHLHGFAGWCAWGIVHLLTLAGFTNKGLVFVNWVINYCTKNSNNRLIVRHSNQGGNHEEKSKGGTGG